MRLVQKALISEVCVYERGGDHSTQERICTEILQQKRRDLIEDLKGQYALG